MHVRQSAACCRFSCQGFDPPVGLTASTGLERIEWVPRYCAALETRRRARRCGSLRTYLASMPCCCCQQLQQQRQRRSATMHASDGRDCRRAVSDCPGGEAWRARMLCCHWLELFACLACIVYSRDSLASGSCSNAVGATSWRAHASHRGQRRQRHQWPQGDPGGRGGRR